MAGRRLVWHLFPTYLAVTLVALVVVAVFSSLSFKSTYTDQTRTALEARARLIAGHIDGDLAAVNDAWCRAIARQSSSRVTVIRTDGVVLGDSERESALMDNHADRPEVIPALRGEVGSSERFSHTLQHEMVYVAVPYRENDRMAAVVRASLPLRTIGEVLGSFYWQMVVATIGVALLAATVSLVISRLMSRPLEEIRRGAERFAKGELTHKLLPPDSEELAALTDSMNQMAAQLDERIRTVTEQRNEHEAILDSMVEGVIAVDTDERIISLNDATGRMFAIDPDAARGKTLQEAIRNSELQEFTRTALKEDEPAQKDILVRGERERALQANGAKLSNAEGVRIGAVIVLNDITKIRRLEQVRRDFVENVSHELKTPITSIKGFIETLRDGGVAEDKRRHFLGIVARQSDRLNAIVEDLLLLARTERASEAGGPPMELTRVCDVLRDAVEDCTLIATEKNITIDVSCDQELASLLSPHLVEQAVANLIDNAVKYSEAGRSVDVAAEKDDGDLVIRVADQGFGIERDKLPRLFERFFRVDKARSRTLGGTGLGLAIVKHIAEAHGGRVAVESVAGEGSTFTIHIPFRTES